MLDQGDLIGQFDEQLVIYHVVDEYTGYVGVREEQRLIQKEMERELLSQVDLVFTTSPALYEARQSYPNVYLVPNAVDYEAFIRAMASPPPADIADLPRPRAGYIGAVNDKLNLSLLAEVAAARPDWNFVIVGPVQIQTPDNLAALTRLKHSPNVHLLGRKAVTEVPVYVLASDVCLLPYQQNIWTEHIDSLKLYEYMAAGKPVIATPVPAARQFGGLVELAADAPAFAQALEKAWNQNTPEQVARRREIAAQNTWDHRVEQLSAAITTVLAKKYPQCKGI